MAAHRIDDDCRSRLAFLCSHYLGVRGLMRLLTILRLAPSCRFRVEDRRNEGKRVLRHAFRRLEQEVPASLGRAIRWLRHPHSRWVRMPIGLLLVFGGIASILPGLGIWMLAASAHRDC